MPKTPKHFIHASNLVLIVLVLSVVYLLLPNIRLMPGMFPLTVAMKVLILALAVFLRLGYSWSKYVLAVVALLSLLGIYDVLDIVAFPRVSAFVAIAQIVLMVYATIVVLKKQSDEGQQRRQ
jgi:hypothetical protein